MSELEVPLWVGSREARGTIKAAFDEMGLSARSGYQGVTIMNDRDIDLDEKYSNRKKVSFALEIIFWFAVLLPLLIHWLRKIL